MTYEIRQNSKFNSLEVYFDGKPSEEVRDILKANRFRWHSVNRCWYGYGISEETLATLITGTTTEDDPAAVIGDGYMGGGAVYGSKSHKWLFGADLSAAVRADLKKAGIKATCKIHSYSGGQSLTITYKTTESDYIPFEEYLERFQISGSGWITYGAGAGEFIHAEKYWSMDAEAQERIRKAAAEYAYTNHTTQENNATPSRIDWLTDEAKATIERIDDIVSAYRYDCSNSMVDYFDTNFYYDICLKPVAG